MNRRNQLTSLAFLLAVSAIQAQETTGTIDGHITTVKGAPIAGALIRATSPSLMGVRSVKTDAAGNYRLPLLPPGNYEVTVTQDGFIAAKATLRLGANSVANQPFSLKGIQETGATVEVLASASSVDKTETATKSSFSTETLTEITGATGSIGYAAVVLSPGVVGSVQYASVRGGSQMGTQYVVNGMSSRDNVTAQGRLGDYTLDDLVEDVSVMQSPLNARFGNTSSGTVNLVTKRGSNEWTGTLRAKLYKEAWNAVTNAPRNRVGALNGTDSPLGTDDLQRTYEFSVTGPLIRDVVSFTYGTRISPSYQSSAQAQNLTANAMNAVFFNGALYPAEKYQEAQTQYGPNKSKYNQFSLFFQLNQDHSLEWNYTAATSTVADIQYNLVTPDIANTSNFQFTEKTFFSIGYKGTFGSNQVLEARYGKNRSDTQFLSGPNSPITLQAGPTAITSYQTMWDLDYTYVVGGGTADNQPDRRATESATLNYSVVVDAKGTHQIDMGYELQQPIWGTVSRDNSFPTQFYTVGQLSTNAASYIAGYAAYNAANAGKYVVMPYGYITSTYGASAANTAYDLAMNSRATYFVGVDKANIKNPTTSLYLNDLWTISQNYSLMLGLRYDKLKLNDARGDRFNSSMLSPRFEFKWDINGDNRRVVNLSYGEFRGILNARDYRTYTEGRLNTKVIRYWNNTAAPALVDYAALTNIANYGVKGGFVSSDMYTIDKNFKPEANDEITLGYRRSFDNGATWRGTIVYRNWKDLRTSVGDPALITVANPVDPTETFTTYKRTFMNDPQAKRQYKGVELEWNAPFGPSWTLAGSYVYGRLTGNNTYGDGTTFGGFQQLALTGFFRPQWQAMGLSSNQFEPNGQLAMSRNHVIKSWLTYRVLSGKTVSTVSLQGAYYAGARESLTNPFYYSSTAQTVPGTLDSNRPISTSIFFNGRGNYSAPDYWTTNLVYNVEATVSSKLRVFTQLVVSNVFNHQIPGALYRDGYATTQNFDSATLGATRGYWSSTSTTNSARYGTGAGYGNMVGARSVSFDFGLKF